MLGKIDSLKLEARSAEDLEVISTFLQDAIVSPSGLHYDEEAKRFVLFGNRFRWEHTADDKERASMSRAISEDESQLERVHVGVSFSNIESVSYHGFHKKHHKDDGLNLLAVVAREHNVIRLIFSANAEIDLVTEAGISVHLRDMGDPWPTHTMPKHDV